MGYYYWQCPGCEWIFSDDINSEGEYCKDCWTLYGCINGDRIGARLNEEGLCEKCVEGEEKTENFTKIKSLSEFLDN